MSRREILQLRLKGMICPCLLSRDDRMALESFEFLLIKKHKKAWQIQWHRPMLLKGLAAGDETTTTNNNTESGEGGGGFFKKLVSSVVTSTVGPNICNATLRIMENQYGIAIKILKIDKDNKLQQRRSSNEHSQGDDEEFGELNSNIDDEEDHDNDDSDNNKRKNKRRERVILLRNIGCVEPSDKHTNGIVFYGIASSSGGSNKSNSNAVGSNDNKGSEILRFDLKAPTSKMTDHELKSLRDDMVDHLGVVCRWDRLRHEAYIEKERAIQASDQDNSTTVLSSMEYDEDGTPLPQRNRAQRVAHFTKREVELTKKQRDRDEKKQKYLAMSGGGLKYTAVAMAQRAASAGE